METSGWRLSLTWCRQWLPALRRLTVKAAGYYLLPWARMSDYLAAVVTSRTQRLAASTWHVACCIFALICLCHVVSVTYIVTAVWSELGLHSEGPCVCKATTHDARLEHVLSLRIVPGSIAVTLANIVKAACFSVVGCLSVLGDLGHVLWFNPVRAASIGLGVLVALSC